jgi:hypothetical protein
MFAYNNENMTKFHERNSNLLYLSIICLFIEEYLVSRIDYWSILNKTFFSIVNENIVFYLI